MAAADSSFARAVIAIDGTAGAGKSSTSRGVASALGLRYLDTGAMYRAVTCAVLAAGVPLGDAAAVARVAAEMRLEIGTDPASARVEVDGLDVTAAIRSAPVTASVSQVSAVPAVRALLQERQRAAIGPGGIVVEGRDIGTVVAPDADLKIFLVADPGARAARRAAQLGAHHEASEQVAVVQADLTRRDAADSGRVVSPLTQAVDAVVVDTTDRTLVEVVDGIVELARERMAVSHVR
jgi:cytidylate kinase